MATKRCGCGRFMGNDVFQVTLDSDTKICHRCWRADQMKGLVGPRFGFISGGMDYWEALKGLFKFDRRFWRMSLCVGVLS